MSEATVRSLAMPRTRSVTYRTRGRAHGPIVRLMSPSDLGEVLKPFVFLDLFEADMGQMRDAMPVHPHSGIATITVFTEGDVRFEDPDADQGTIAYGGVEWLQAGGGCGKVRNSRLECLATCRASSFGSPFRRSSRMAPRKANISTRRQ